jgi:hypothetical protein
VGQPVTDFAKAKESIERIVHYIEGLIEQGKSPDEAFAHAALYFGMVEVDVRRIYSDFAKAGRSGNTIYGETGGYFAN